ncbi:hypothetical protein [Streptomyces cavernicola]|uniref:Integral membrane protein n=1 Tax=Streptomyces cavernicola TaxID=3043613 RepID=A0ABT6SF67_9ACTN|nr:hypothetical protein [Streptomyces sp. B-S-A6]MDI3405941.1 hypothetical protein [Streptomyces sp. B-S-A6]
MSGARVLRAVQRLTVLELHGMHSLLLWVARRRHGVSEGARAFAYTGPQTAMLFGLLFVAVLETVALAVLIPWPAVHAIVLFLDVYTVLQVLALHAACVVRPHVVGADGSLRIRYGHLLDLRIPAEGVGRAHVARHYPAGKRVQEHPDGSLDLLVGSQTTVTVELAAPVTFVRPLGRRVEVTTAVRFHADDPQALVAALKNGRPTLTPGRTGPSPSPGRPG